MKVLIIILSVILILCAVGAADVLLRRNSDMIKIMDWHGKKKEIPPIRTGLPEIPYDAVLYSLNWGQSASNEYECFVFNLSCDEDGCYISGKYVVPENDRHIERKDVPLADDYSPEKSYCTNASHNHFDADRLVDASAGILCETTFFFKGQDHETTARNSVIIRLATKILSDNTFSDVYSDPAFPQFNFARDSHDFEDYLAYWRNFDRSTLTPENREKLENALASAEAAVNSTCMPTEEFDKIKDDFYSAVYEIQNGSPEPEETPDILLEFVTKLLKWYSELLLKLYGSKGWHDIIFH